MQTVNTNRTVDVSLILVFCPQVIPVLLTHCTPVGFIGRPFITTDQVTKVTQRNVLDALVAVEPTVKFVGPLLADMRT